MTAIGVVILCGNPKCGRRFSPTHGRQKQCGRACTVAVGSQRRNARGRVGERSHALRTTKAPTSLLAWAQTTRREALRVLEKDDDLTEDVMAHLEALDAELGALERALVRRG